MTSVDNTYDDGAIFTYKTQLEIGAHDYYFIFNDGQVEVRYPATGTINGPNVVRSNEAPTLTLVSVEPEVGHRNTEFQFYVTYTDADDDAPSSTNIIIDGTENSMTPSSTFYSDGVIYFYSTFLSLGMHQYHFEFNDSRVEVRAPLVPDDVYDGPEVKNRAPIPVLSEPSEGNVFNNEDMIKFDASSSSDPDGDPITIEIYSDLDGFLGADSTVSTNLSAGDHTIILTVKDNLNGSSSLTVNITVVQLEPNLSNIDITITPDEPVEGETITVKATISNTGDAPAIDVEVKISVDGVTVFEDTITKINDKNAKSIEKTITATAGDHILKVAIVDGLEKTLEYSVEERAKPSAAAGEDVTVYVNEDVSFDGSNSNSSGIIVTYFWDFGDDTNKTGKFAKHSYDKKGTYSVELTVTDEIGKEDSDFVTVRVLAKKSSSTSDEFEMDTSSIAIIILVIIIIVFVLALIMIKRKKKTDDADDYFTGQTAAPPQQQTPPLPQGQLGYISPPPGTAMQQPDLQTIAPPQDLILEQPEDDYYHPRHEHYTAASDAESLYEDAPPQPAQENELPEEDLASLLPENISEDTPPQVQTETISQEPIESPPQPTVAPQPTVKVSDKVPKIVKKTD
jgi:PKD repeat protein